jgi:amidohydrolase
MITPELVRERVAAHHEHTVAIRRHLHANPELSFAETETARFVTEELERLGIETTPGVGGNGVVGLIRGSRTGTTRALRADMDALPIEEVAGRPYGSQHPGVMHACGHDGHTASLLAAAAVINDLKEELSGAVKLLFQPAEERVPGGAQAMIADGVLSAPNVDVVFGQHVNTELPSGTVGFNGGLFMASADEIYITVTGRGGHAAKPHQGRDPIAIASTLIVTLQQLVSRNADPTVPSVLTFGRISGNGAANVIPDTVELDGTFRTMHDEWREDALAAIESTARAICNGLGAEVAVTIKRGYPALVNDASTTAFARERALAYVGEQNVVDLPPAMWAEDFAYFAQNRPSCFYNLGVRNEQKGIVYPVHTPRFDLDEAALETGAGLLAWIALG